MTDSRIPLVSIITATYNRGNVLRYTVASVIESGFRDWELLVVGDACTDDTEQVVGSFADPRVRFINLETNVGEQSGPSNEGFRHARGRYIAYLNHDDLWTADHLGRSLSAIEDTGADLVFSLGVAVEPGGGNVLIGASPTGTLLSRLRRAPLPVAPEADARRGDRPLAFLPRLLYVAVAGLPDTGMEGRQGSPDGPRGDRVHIPVRSAPQGLHGPRVR